MKVVGVWVAGLVLFASGCASTRVMQRDGCWVRQTEKWPNRVTEELGPCARPEPSWSEDRLARLAQECIVQSDYRWQAQALAAWNRGEPLPAVPKEDAVMRSCIDEAASSIITENESLRRRLDEVASDREALRVAVKEDRVHLRSSHDLMVEALGEAAKKPAPNAVATATSSGTANTQSDVTSPQHAASPGLTLTTVPMCAMPQKGANVQAVKQPEAKPDAKANVKKKATTTGAAPNCPTKEEALALKADASDVAREKPAAPAAKDAAAPPAGK